MIKKGSTIDFQELLSSSHSASSFNIFFNLTFDGFLYNQFTHNISYKENQDLLCLTCDKFLYSEEFISRSNPYKENSVDQTYCSSCLGSKSSLEKYFQRGLWSLYLPPTAASTSHYKGYNSSLSRFISALDSDSSYLLNFSLQFLSVILTNFFQQVMNTKRELDSLWSEIWDVISSIFHLDNFLFSSSFLQSNSEIVSESFFLVKPWLIFESGFPLQSFISFSGNEMRDFNSLEGLFFTVQDFLLKNLSEDRWALVLLICDSFAYRFSIISTPFLSLGQSLPLIINPKERHDLSLSLFYPYLDEILLFLEGKEINGGYPDNDVKNPRSSLPSPWCLYEMEIDYIEKIIKDTEKNKKILEKIALEDKVVTYSNVYDAKERVCARISQAASSLSSMNSSTVANPFLQFVYQNSFLNPFFSLYIKKEDNNISQTKKIYQSCQANIIMDVSHNSVGFMFKFIANSDIYSGDDFTFNFNHHGNGSVDSIIMKENNIIKRAEDNEKSKYFLLNKNKLLFDIKNSLFFECSCPLCNTSYLDLYSLSCYEYLSDLKRFHKKIKKSKKSKILSNNSKYFTKNISTLFYQNIKKFETLLEQFKKDSESFEENKDELNKKLFLIDGLLKSKFSILKKIILYSNNLLNNSKFSLAILYYASFFNEIMFYILNPQLILIQLNINTNLEDNNSKKRKSNEEQEKYLVFIFFKKFYNNFLSNLFNSFSAILFDIMISIHSNPSEFLIPLSSSLVEYSNFFKNSKNSNDNYYEIRRFFNLELIVLLAKFSLFYDQQNSEVSNFLNKFCTYEKDSNLSLSKFPFKKILEVQTKPFESSSVFLTASPILSLQECSLIIQTAREYAEKHEGWTTSRHYSVPTTDIPIHSLSNFLVPSFTTNNLTTFPIWFNNLLDERIRPLLMAQFVEDETLIQNCQVFINDLFIVKYEGQKQDEMFSGKYLKKFNYQKYLPLHTDQSTHSFTISLNSCLEFEGGGTYFSSLPLHQNVRSEVGNLISFNGNILHGGEPVHFGTRYIIAGFTIILPRFISIEKWLESCDLEENNEEYDPPKEQDEVEVSLGSIFFERQKKIDENNNIIDSEKNQDNECTTAFSFSFF